MAGIIKRFKDIMSANINALLDKAEDPEKMIDQYLRDMESDLGKVKAETAAVMAEETRAKRELDECGQEIEKMQRYAEKALTAGNEEDARKFLEKGDKVKVTLRFRGREMAHMSKSKYILDDFAEELSDIATIDKPSKVEGRTMVMFLTAKR